MSTHLLGQNWRAMFRRRQYALGRRSKAHKIETFQLSIYPLALVDMLKQQSAPMIAWTPSESLPDFDRCDVLSQSESAFAISCGATHFLALTTRKDQRKLVRAWKRYN
jgi:hypothetical protein